MTTINDMPTSLVRWERTQLPGGESNYALWLERLHEAPVLFGAVVPDAERGCGYKAACALPTSVSQHDTVEDAQRFLLHTVYRMLCSAAEAFPAAIAAMSGGVPHDD